MSGTTITDQQLKKQLNNIGLEDWKRAAEKMGFIVVKGTHGSHSTHIRDPRYPDPSDIRGQVTTVTPYLFKQANEQIFKKLMKFGKPDDEIWKSLGMKK